MSNTINKISINNQNYDIAVTADNVIKDGKTLKSILNEIQEKINKNSDIIFQELPQIKLTIAYLASLIGALDANNVTNINYNITQVIQNKVQNQINQAFNDTIFQTKIYNYCEQYLSTHQTGGSQKYGESVLISLIFSTPPIQQITLPDNYTPESLIQN